MAASAGRPPTARTSAITTRKRRATTGTSSGRPEAGTSRQRHATDDPKFVAQGAATIQFSGMVVELKCDAYSKSESDGRYLVQNGNAGGGGIFQMVLTNQSPPATPPPWS